MIPMGFQILIAYYFVKTFSLWLAHIFFQVFCYLPSPCHQRKNAEKFPSVFQHFSFDMESWCVCRITHFNFIRICVLRSCDFVALIRFHLFLQRGTFQKHFGVCRFCIHHRNFGRKWWGLLWHQRRAADKRSTRTSKWGQIPCEVEFFVIKISGHITSES